MQRVLIGALILIALYFAAMNAHLRGRERFLEQQLADAEARQVSHRNAGTEPAVPAPATVTVGAPARASAPAPKVEPPLPAAAPQGTPTPKNGTPAWGNGQLVFHVAEPDLGLTDSQKKVIDELRRNRDALSKSHQDVIDQLALDTEQAIRAVLTPEQLARYESQSTMFVQSQPDPAPSLPPGVRPGYLGITGGDAPGGGASIGQVLPETAAGASGLQPGDVILEFNGERVDTLAALSSRVRGAGEGGAVNIRIRRGQTEFQQPLQLGGLPK